jgi:hypothetical protein
MLISLQGPRRGVLGHVVDEDVPDLLPVLVEPCDVLPEVGRLGLPGMRPDGLDQDEVVYDGVKQTEPELEQRKLVIEEKTVPDSRSIRHLI